MVIPASLKPADQSAGRGLRGRGKVTTDAEGLVRARMVRDRLPRFPLKLLEQVPASTGVSVGIGAKGDGWSASDSVDLSHQASNGGSHSDVERRLRSCLHGCHELLRGSLEAEAARLIVVDDPDVGRYAWRQLVALGHSVAAV